MQIIESCIKKLKDLNKPFKYIGARTRHAAICSPTLVPRCSRPFVLCSSLPVTAVIMQKNGAGLHTATSCFWDNTTDGARLAHLQSCLAPGRDATSRLAADLSVPMLRRERYIAMGEQEHVLHSDRLRPLHLSASGTHPPRCVRGACLHLRTQRAERCATRSAARVGERSAARPLTSSCWCTVAPPCRVRWFAGGVHGASPR